MPNTANAIQRLMGETYLLPPEENPMFANWINSPRTQRELEFLTEWPGSGTIKATAKAGVPAVMAMTNPEALGKVINTMKKMWGTVDPKAIEIYRRFLGRYPAKALDTLKWMEEVSPENIKNILPGLMGRYWPKQTVQHYKKTGKIAKELPSYTDLPEGAGFFYQAPKGKGALDFVGTAIHEKLHHLAEYLGIKDVEKTVQKTEKALVAGEPSEYYDYLLDLFERSKQIKARGSMAPAAQAIERLKTEELIPRIERQLAEAQAKGDKYYIKKFEDQLRRAKKGAETGQWESELGGFAPDVTGIMVP